MKNKIYLIALLIICLAIQSCKNDSYEREREVFEKAMAKALGLKLISRDVDYRFSRIEIFNDTIVGFYINSINNELYKYYFIQSITNPKIKVKFNNFDLIYPSISPINAYRNGCLYFQTYGKGTMQSLCSDGKLTEYFKQYRDTLFYANKIMLYKNKAAITSMNGVYVFDISSQKLIWKHKFRESPMEGLSSIIGNKLILTETIHELTKGYTQVICLDLDKLTIKWKNVINNDADYLYDQEYLPHYHLNHDANNVIIPEVNACYALDLNSGNIKGKVAWKNFFTVLSHNPRFNVENNRLYVNDYNHNTTLLCIDIISNKKLWQIKNIYYSGLYKNFVIATTVDLKFYLIINKITGKILYKISKPKSNQMDFDFINKYIFINHKSIYK